jgi:hypothetical protein
MNMTMESIETNADARYIYNSRVIRKPVNPEVNPAVIPQVLGHVT